MPPTIISMNAPPYRDCFEQVYRMALAAWQSHTFWVYTRLVEPLHEDVLKSYGHFFCATHEAHLTMAVLSLDCLFNTNKPKFHNFETLLRLAKEHIDKKIHAAMKNRLKKLQVLAKKIQVLRNNSFAHITDKDIRETAGQRYSLTHEEFLTLAFNAIRLATEIGVLLRENVITADPQAILDRDILEITALYAALGGEGEG